MRWLFAAGFFSSSQIHTALVIGGVAAVVSAVVGVFAVLRGQSFGGHTLTESSATGGSAATLAAVNPLLGFVGGAVAGAGAMEAVGVRHARGRDLATGIVLAGSIGLAALFLYLNTSRTATTGAPQQVLFGSIFATVSGTVPMTAGFGVAALAIVAVIHRPLMLSTVSPDMAAAQGVPVRIVGMAYMLALALAVGLSSLTVGALLSTALLIGPPAAAVRVTKRLGSALVVASLVGVAATWIGVLLAYDSTGWFGGHDGLPVSFFIVLVVFAGYVLSGLTTTRFLRRTPSGPPRS